MNIGKTAYFNSTQWCAFIRKECALIRVTMVYDVSCMLFAFFPFFLKISFFQKFFKEVH